MIMNKEDKMLYTVKEASATLGVSIHLVYDLINKGLLPALKLGSLKIRKETINEFTKKYEGMDLSDLDHIKELNIDERLANKDETLVNELAKVKINDKEKNFYSFATKYCSHHDPINYPIYDSYVEKILMHFKKIDNFSNFKRDDLKEYPKFKQILIEFKKYYDIDDYNLKDIDKYLWQLGKEYYPNNY